MRRRKYPARPPTSSNYTSGEVLTFAPSDNEPDPSKMAEVITIGSAPIVLEVKPEVDLVNAGKPLPPEVELTPVPAKADAKKKATRELASELALLLAASENPRQALLEVIDQITRAIESGACPAPEPLKE